MFIVRATDSGLRSRKGSSGQMPAAVTLMTAVVRVPIIEGYFYCKCCLQPIYTTILSCNLTYRSL